MYSNMIIREAVPTDVEGIATVHVESWKTTYRGLIAEEFLEQLTVEGRTNYWARVFQTANQVEGLFVAVDRADRVIGFAHGGKCREADCDADGELYAIYLLEGHQRQGLGSRLFQAVSQYLESAGYRSMLIWVLKGNPALQFYLKMGGHPTIEKSKRIGKEELDEIALEIPLSQ